MDYQQGRIIRYRQRPGRSARPGGGAARYRGIAGAQTDAVPGKGTCRSAGQKPWHKKEEGACLSRQLPRIAPKIPYLANARRKYPDAGECRRAPLAGYQVKGNDLRYPAFARPGF